MVGWFGWLGGWLVGLGLVWGHSWFFRSLSPVMLMFMESTHINSCFPGLCAVPGVPAVAMEVAVGPEGSVLAFVSCVLTSSLLTNFVMLVMPHCDLMV